LAAVCGLLTVFALGPQATRADEVSAGTEQLFSERYEVRLGALAHGVWGVENGSVSLNGEFVAKKVWFYPVAPEWRWLIPRFHVGIMGNTGGKTSYAYAGGLWTYDVTRKLFAEIFLGGALHDGSLVGEPVDPGRSGLGCRVEYHLGGSIGYRITPQWSAMVTLDHVSNGKGVWSNCQRNQGLNEVGVRVGYSF
jgi:hypothetical protein